MRGVVGLLALCLALVAGPAHAQPGADRAVAVRKAAPTLTVGTFNVGQSSEPGGSSWAPRQNKAIALLRRLNADVLGVQEASLSYQDAIKCTWPRCPPKQFPAGVIAKRLGYQIVPLTNLNGRWEVRQQGHQLLYRSARMRLKYWGRLGSIAEWAEFTDRRTKRPLVVVNVHFDPGASVKADRLRADAARRTLDRLAQARSQLGLHRVPAVVLGDFNAPTRGKNTRAATVMKKSGFANAAALTKHRTNAKLNTFNGFRRRAAATGRHIDQIWVAHRLTVTRWDQVARVRKGRYVGRFPSDHNPISARLTVPRS